MLRRVFFLRHETYALSKREDLLLSRPGKHCNKSDAATGMQNCIEQYLIKKVGKQTDVHVCIESHYFLLR